ncbi:hypothetical protein TrVFT333_002413 [Trichoderma virens FT-333]|nr:hypothetical protein TrVFT333_002413 [Trichoderma virens FT-333]
MASPFSLPAALNPPITGREGVADAIYRCALAWDTNDTALFDSSFMPDGVFEVNDHTMNGLPEIHATGLALIFKLDTTHLVTNVRVHMGEDNEASLTATVLVQHFVKGKGMEPSQKSLMSGSLYYAELANDTDGLWKFKHLKIKSIWVEGDYGVIGDNFSEVGW